MTASEGGLRRGATQAHSAPVFSAASHSAGAIATLLVRGRANLLTNEQLQMVGEQVTTRVRESARENVEC